MLIIHDGNGTVTGLQLFPLTSELPHIEASDDLYLMLEPFIGRDIQLGRNGEQFFLPPNLHEHLANLSMDKRREEKLSEIECAQSDALAAGVEFDFGPSTDSIQTRTQRDLINISGVAMRGMLLRANGNTEAVIQFRAQSNTSYMITGDQAIALGESVAQHTEAIYAKAWALKDAIQSATTLAELEVITW